MKHPPYQLRSNKAVDRYLFVEVLKRVFSLRAGQGNNEPYTYVGFGGPFLEDFKIIDHYFPEMRLISVEEKPEVVKRQRFHRFCKGVRLLETTDKRFVESLEDETLLAFWLDYIGCEPSNFDVFGEAVKKAANYSILRITLNASFNANDPFKKDFLKNFEQILPADAETYFENDGKYLILLQRMLRVATTPPPMAGYDFHLLSSASYRDGKRMLTITGIKCADADWPAIEALFSDWRFFTAGWDKTPNRIDVPDLSIQERTRLAGLLPTSKNVGTRLHRRLGYSISGTDKASAEDLESYAAFSRYFPIFVRLAI